ncbi:MAG: site-specific integrase [Gemmatimonadota bacterium]|nr:MAG: site-specific integrase [Gemmatimonadota bacterium]
MTELEYVIAHSPKLRPRTKAIYTRAVQSFLAYAGTHPSAWTGVAVESWRDALAADLKPQTVNLYLTGLKYASRRIAARHHDPRLDFAGYSEQLKADPPASRKALSFEEGHALVDACRGLRPIDLRDTAIVVLGLRTGMRRAGMCGIRFDDLGDDHHVTITLKGGKRHTIQLDTESIEALEPWLTWLEREGVASGHVFRSLSRPRLDGTVQIGSQLRPDGLYKALKRRAEAANIPRFHPHIFRHTYVTWMRERGVPDWKIASITGHKLPGQMSSSMIDRYTSGPPRAISEALPPLLMS